MMKKKIHIKEKKTKEWKILSNQKKGKQLLSVSNNAIRAKSKAKVEGQK